ncbi:hypothetical protein, partial [Escherichia coli]|uniref:hypothetical protein n=1 Tax=Escherichia coli TaxID=562 RepID=UPI0019D55BBA
PLSQAAREKGAERQVKTLVAMPQIVLSRAAPMAKVSEPLRHTMTSKHRLDPDLRHRKCVAVVLQNRSRAFRIQ